MNVRSKSVLLSFLTLCLASGLVQATEPGVGAFTACVQREMAHTTLEAPGSPHDCNKHIRASIWCITDGESGDLGFNTVTAVTAYGQMAVRGLLDRDVVYPTLSQYGEWGYGTKETCL